MAAVLLDTQALLVWTRTPDELGPHAARLLGDGRTRVAVSAVSVWEVAVKHRKGKLPLREGWFDRLFAADVRFLPLDERHALAAALLPLHHADPFDRMLVAQAQAEGLALIGSDAAFAAYDVDVIW